MTFVGKILVIIIMAFALFFLAISTVVFTTSKNWKAEADELNAQVNTLRTEKAAADARAAQADEAVKAAQAAMEQQTGQLEARIAEIQRQNEQAQQELTEQRTAATVAQQKVQTALDDSEARRQETEQLRDLLSQVQEQANEFKLRQTELNEEILQLRRYLETAQNNNRELRERVGLYSNVIRRAGLSDDVGTLRGVSAPPDVEGQVVQVDANNRRVVISIGSDDGLVVGHELELWRTQPNAEYLGRLRIEAVDPDRAVGSVIGNTVQGKKIQEGDLVSTQIRPRG